MSLRNLDIVLQGIAWTAASDAEYHAACPDAAVDINDVTELEILVYLGGPHAGSSCVNWTIGGTCEWCGRATRTCPGHRPDGVLVTRTDIPEGPVVAVNGFRMTTNGHTHPASFSASFSQ